jgi:hypothetical protein
VRRGLLDCKARSSINSVLSTGKPLSKIACVLRFILLVGGQIQVSCRVWQKKIIFKESCAGDHWFGRSALEPRYNSTDRNFVSTDPWSAELRAFVVKMLLENSESVALAQHLFRLQLNIKR